jgi:light-regulated signal transduction histidine kinase (bacteriophytochrome)
LNPSEFHRHERRHQHGGVPYIDVTAVGIAALERARCNPSAQTNPWFTSACDAMLYLDTCRRAIVLHSRANGSSVTIEVSDQGSGLPAHEADRIFEPFFTTKSAGMGIGLSICKTVIEEHGGQIQAFTNETGGATFRILVPTATGDTRVEEGKPPSAQQA